MVSGSSRHASRSSGQAGQQNVEQLSGLLGNNQTNAHLLTGVFEQQRPSRITLFSVMLFPSRDREPCMCQELMIDANQIHILTQQREVRWVYNLIRAQRNTQMSTFHAVPLYHTLPNTVQLWTPRSTSSVERSGVISRWTPAQQTEAHLALTA